MKKMDEDTALSIIFANTKRKKRYEDLLTIAKAFDYLVKLSKYSSQQAVAKKVGLSSEMIRQFLSVLKLPKEVQKLISERRIDSVDIVKELAAIKDPMKQLAAAYALRDSQSKDVRDIKRLVKNEDFPIKEAKKTILNAKPKGLHIFVIDFDDEMYQAILNSSKIHKIKPPELVKKIIKDWLDKESRKKNKRQ